MQPVESDDIDLNVFRSIIRNLIRMRDSYNRMAKEHTILNNMIGLSDILANNTKKMMKTKDGREQVKLVMDSLIATVRMFEKSKEDFESTQVRYYFEINFFFQILK